MRGEMYTSRMSYTIRRYDGRVLEGWSGSDVKHGCIRGELWPDEELRSQDGRRWSALSAVPSLAEALAQGAAMRASTEPLHPERLTKDNAPAVVQVMSSCGSGTGFAIDSEGMVLTNDHVVSESTVCRVRFHNGLESAARVIRRGDSVDLAAVKCALPTPSFMDLNARRPASVAQGARAFALGYPGHVDCFSITAGLVSALNVTRQQMRWHQISAPVNPGNSGGPVLGERGELIGVATQRESWHSDGRHTEGIAWAIPFEEVCAFTRRLWSEILDGHVSVPSSSDLMRECIRPDPADEIQLAVRRLVREQGFRVLESSNFNGGPLRSARLAGPEGELVDIVLDRYPLSPDRDSGPWYLYMYSPLGEIPADANAAVGFHRRALELNMKFPHWHFAESDGRLLLRLCRQANLLDAVEVLHAVEDLQGIANWMHHQGQ